MRLVDEDEATTSKFFSIDTDQNTIIAKQLLFAFNPLASYPPSAVCSRGFVAFHSLYDQFTRHLACLHQFINRSESTFS